MACLDFEFKPMMAFQEGDIVQLKGDLNVYTLYTSRDGVVYESLSPYALPFLGKPVKIVRAVNNRYEIKSVKGEEIPGVFVDGMFERGIVSANKKDNDRDSEYKRIEAFAKRYNSHGRTIKELELLVDKTIKEFARNDAYGAITRIAELAREAKLQVDEDKDPREVFSQIAEEAQRHIEFRSDKAVKSSSNVKDKLIKLRPVWLGAVASLVLTSVTKEFIDVLMITLLIMGVMICCDLIFND